LPFILPPFVPSRSAFLRPLLEENTHRCLVSDSFTALRRDSGGSIGTHIAVKVSECLIRQPASPVLYFVSVTGIKISSADSISCFVACTTIRESLTNLNHSLASLVRE
jgi:hypothetical protein